MGHIRTTGAAMPLSPKLAARLAETSCWDDLTEEEQDALTMAWLDEEGRLNPNQEAIPSEDIPEINEDASS
jgi:hypothetical protein